jgi:hypothetical protein
MVKGELARCLVPRIARHSALFESAFMPPVDVSVLEISLLCLPVKLEIGMNMGQLCLSVLDLLALHSECWVCWVFE